jgi:hypothetical protein
MHQPLVSSRSGLLPYVMCGRLGAKGVKPLGCEPVQS